MLGALREVRFIPCYDVRKFLEATKGRLPPLEEAILQQWDGCLADLDRYLPELRTIGATYRWGRGPDDELLASPLWHRVHTIVAHSSDENIGSWFRALQRHRSRSLRAIRLIEEPPDRGALVYDLETREIDMTVDKHTFVAALVAPEGAVKRIRARGKIDEKTLGPVAKKLGAELELLR
jgi:hypothetical protein